MLALNVHQTLIVLHIPFTAVLFKISSSQISFTAFQFPVDSSQSITNPKPSDLFAGASVLILSWPGQGKELH